MPNLPYRPPPLPRKPPPAAPPGGRPPLPQARRLRRALRRSPCVLISAAIHLAILLLGTLSVRRPRAPEPGAAHPMQVSFYVEKPSPPKRAPEPAPEPPETAPAPPEPDPPPKKAPPGTRQPLPAPLAERATVPAPPVLAASPGPRPARDLFAARTPAGRARALRRWGGTPASEIAVDAGLAWLHRHQDADSGRWADGDPVLRLSPSLTSLALLAFLGKGHTQLADGPYRDTVARGIHYLLRIQASDGRFGPPYHPEDNRYLMYHQALATLALAEAYALTHDGRLRTPVRRAVAFIERAQQSGGGWDYGDRATGRNDTSVAGWQLLALKSAHAAGFPVNWQTLFGAMRHLVAMTNRRGQVGYANRGTYAWRRGPAMVAVGMLSRQILGWPRQSEALTRQAALLLRELPDWQTMRSRQPLRHLHTMYYWYYGTLAMFQMGGQAWESWNGRLREVLVAHQQRRGDERGSWDPPAGGFDSAGGRVYATAINVLSLEVYYRYLPFHSARGFDALEVLERAARVRGSRVRREALRLLGEFKDERAEAILAEALHDSSTRPIARQALVKLGSEKVIPALVHDIETGHPASVRVQAISLLDRLNRATAAPALIQALRDPEKVVRHRAVIALRRLTGQSFQYRPDAAKEQREAAVRKWQEWWEEENARPPPGGIRGTVLVTDPESPNIVVLDVGRKHAVRPGFRFEVVRDGRPIALLEAEQVKPTLTIARIVRRGKVAIRAGDPVRSIPASTP